MASILIIDDEQHVRYLLKAVLEPMGHQVVEATNGKEALKAIQGSSPALMIVDIYMPEMDGIELIKNARCTQPDIKIIAISGALSMEKFDVLEVAQRLGARYTLQKPFEIRALINMVQDIFPPEPVPRQSA